MLPGNMDGRDPLAQRGLRCPSFALTCLSPGRRSRPVLKSFAELHGRHAGLTVS